MNPGANPLLGTRSIHSQSLLRLLRPSIHNASLRLDISSGKFWGLEVAVNAHVTTFLTLMLTSVTSLPMIVVWRMLLRAHLHMLVLRWIRSVEGSNDRNLFILTPYGRKARSDGLCIPGSFWGETIALPIKTLPSFGS
jgi:hypothetical protein